MFQVQSSRFKAQNSGSVNAGRMLTTDDSSNRFRAGRHGNPIHRFWVQQIFIPILHRADAEGSCENPLLHRLLIVQWRRHRSALFIITLVNFHVSGIPETWKCTVLAG